MIATLRADRFCQQRDKSSKGRHSAPHLRNDQPHGGFQSGLQEWSPPLQTLLISIVIIQSVMRMSWYDMKPSKNATDHAARSMTVNTTDALHLHDFGPDPTQPYKTLPEVTCCHEPSQTLDH